MSLHVAVLGATGGQGGAVVDALLEGGHAVRAVARDPGSLRARTLRERGVEVVRGDLGEPSSLGGALEGVDAAFAVTTPFEFGPEAEVEQGLAVVRAAARTGLPHLVFSSVASADRRTGVPHFESKQRIEEVLAQEGPPWTVVAPTYFFENLLGDPQALRSGWLEFPIPPDRPLQQVARRDLGALVAAVVADRDRHLGRRVEVASDAPTPARMAAVLERALGRPVEPVQVPLSLVRQGSADMGAMWDFLSREGYAVDIGALHRAYPDIAWTSFEAWAEGLTAGAPRPAR
ncbi:NmrA/HSCARG family protein [Streptacidiphilus sp. ASG 303]|uniref:NmrA/HSCARG family protein n=1 Tax=Streptacidiphilus sp. ASG 303 TaxID=2896847 RepID=UPI001E53DDD6|nr:NmrA/HSCARG family protein [Streptacidiphilus sp. ASG 303]MCD0483630.1 NmrA/HSCARG family protein [Streptacidiphilus sp. ASG 303]